MRIDSSLLFTLGKLVDFLDRRDDGLYILANANNILVDLSEFQNMIEKYAKEKDISIYKKGIFNTDGEFMDGYYFTLCKRIPRSIDDQNIVKYALTHTFKYVQIVFKEKEQKYGIRAKRVQHNIVSEYVMEGEFTTETLDFPNITDSYKNTVSTNPKEFAQFKIIHDISELFKFI